MKIITDSTADLSADLLQKYNIGMVPLTIHLGDKTWLDFYDVEPDAYYAMLRNSAAFPTTSQPSPQDFIDVYSPIVENGDPILSVQISSKLSGTYQSAVLARSHFPEARIEVIDSFQASLGLGMIILLCAEKMVGGVSFERVVQHARDLSERVQTYFFLDSLDHLQRGGRIGKAQAFLGTLMKIKPLLKLADGEVQPLEKIRTREKLLNRLVELVEKEAQEGPGLWLSMGESDNTEIATALLERLLSIPGVSFLHRCKLGGVITSHAGPGTLGICFVRE